MAVNMGGKKGGSHAKTGGDSNLEADELTAKEQKAAPDVADALAHATEPDGGLTPEEDDGEELSTASQYISSIPVGHTEYQLSYVVKEAKRDSGLTTKQWNELDTRQRTVCIDKTLDRLRAEAQEELEKARAEQNVAAPEPQKDVRVHETRGIGGRFVAVGGGERIRVAEASSEPDATILDDAELEAQQASAEG